MKCPRCQSENTIVTGTMEKLKNHDWKQVEYSYQTYDCLDCQCWFDDLDNHQARYEEL